MKIRLPKVDRGGTWARWVLLPLMAMAGSLIAQEAELPPVTTVVVPVVGNIDGQNGVRWVTALQLRNDTGRAVDVWLVLPSTWDAPAFSISLAPGQAMAMRDVIAEAFGTDSALSALRVITSGRRSVTISVTVYAMRGGEIAATQPIPIDYASFDVPLRALPGLSFSDDFRTNVGLVNLNEDRPARFTLALQRIAGRNIALTTIIVPAATIVHTPVQSLFPLITKGDDFTVAIETTERDTYVYASVINNTTSAARFVRPTMGLPLVPVAKP